MAKHTAGPWHWQVNATTRQVHLCTTGRGRVFVMGFARWGMQRGQPMFQVHREGCDGACRGCGVLKPLSELVDSPDHNGYAELDHPDARLIAAAPELLEACTLFVDILNDHARIGEHGFQRNDRNQGYRCPWCCVAFNDNESPKPHRPNCELKSAFAAIAKAEGQEPTE